MPNMREMRMHVVECLACGDQRPMHPGHDAGECTRCGYVGWARADELSEQARRALRERPLATRRIRITAVA